MLGHLHMCVYPRVMIDSHNTDIDNEVFIQLFAKTLPNLLSLLATTAG
jgi:hypothetical protein